MKSCHISAILLILTAGAVLPARADVLYDSFETASDLNIPTAYDATISQSPIHNTEGDWSAKIGFANDHSSIRFRNTASWWNASALAFDATTDETAPLPLIVTVESGDTRFPVRLTLQPGRGAHVSIPCDALSRGRIDSRDFGAYSISGTGPPVLLTAVKSFSIGPANGAGSVSFFLDNVRLIQSPETDGPLLVDEFGQYVPVSWPGRVSNSVEMQVDAAQEPVWLASWRRPADLDRFGGQRGGNLRQSPFFTVQKVGNHWRLVDPEGNPFFVRGVNQVSIESAAAAPGPRAVYAALPANPGSPNFLEANLRRKFGAGFRSAWRQMAAARLQKWGFNTLGPDSDPDVSTALPRIVDLGSSSALTGIHHLGPFPDVFDPGFAAAARQALQKVAPYREAHNIIGYTFDHALPWDRLQDPTFVLTSGGPAADYLKALAARSHPEEPDPRPADMAAFLTEFASRYFRGIRAAIHASDHDHHLYLGCRFLACPPSVARAAAPFVDALTFDDYGLVPLSHGPDASVAGLDRPILISAFSFGATDRGLMSGGFQPVASQAARAAAYTAYVRACAASPLILGCLWDRYVDEPVITASGPGANCGLVTLTDRPYPELTLACAQVNTEAHVHSYISSVVH